MRQRAGRAGMWYNTCQWFQGIADSIGGANMARDPFAPVTQPSIPPWVLPVGIVLGVLFLGTAIATVLVVSRRPAVQPVIAAPAITAPTPAAPPSKESVAAAGTASAPDTAKDPARSDEGKDPDHARHHRARAVKDKT